MRDIRGKRALVTGAASGIGRAIALRLASAGAAIFLVDIDKDKLLAVADEVRAHEVECIAQTCDVSNPEEIATSVDRLVNTWGTLDILVNNAGVCYYGRVNEMSDQQWQRLLAINVHAPVDFIRRLLPMLLDRPEAHIVNVASMYGLIATNRCAAYHLSKFALVGFSEALRAEYGRTGLGVTMLCPGFVCTNLFTSMVTPGREESVRRPPRWVCTTPERVAKKTLAGIHRNRRMVLVSPLAYAAYYVRRLAPGLLDKLYHIGRRKAKPGGLVEPSNAAVPLAARPAVLSSLRSS
ncbi:MAG: SDR family NAD(P)-dependent oxidoreductase [Planctomycetales bacterium]|nr:SDR family NAD(P)-dependent oxidoreductase [Planctomycetales bacterium]